MNAERLHIIALAVIEDLENTELIQYITNLVNALQNRVNSPQNAEFQKNVSENLNIIYEKLDESAIDNFTPAWSQLLEELGAENLFGNDLKKRLQEIFERNQITPSIVLEEIKAILSDLNNFNNALERITEGFDHLSIGAEELEPGECEIGILVPRGAVDNKLGNFAKELEFLDKRFGIFYEITTENRPGFTIKNISSSDLTVYLVTISSTAALIATAVDRIINSYKNILEIKKHHNELLEKKVPKKELAGIENYANSLMDKEIKKLAKELIKEYSNINKVERKRELETELRITLRQIANRIDNGYNIDIRTEPINEEDKENNTVSDIDKKHIQKILDTTKTRQFIKIEGAPILSLPEPKPNSDKCK